MQTKIKITMIYVVLIYTSLFLGACEPSSESVRIQRNPMIKANINGENWQTKEYIPVSLGKTVYYEDMNDATGVLYERLHLTIFNNAQYPQQLQFIIDVKDPKNMIGEYGMIYTEGGGIHEVMWTDHAASPDFYPLFSICEAFEPTVKIVIEKQSTSEKLISGTFEMTLCDRTNAGNTLIISQGEFKDIHL
jgi:hypothetical protein